MVSDDSVMKKEIKNKKEKKIIILMSVYNGEKYLNEQLESISNQTIIEQVKLFIRDDGSKDNSINIITNWKDRLDINLIQGKNIGPAKSFFELLKIDISAEYYAFCDQDDYWYPDKLEKAIEKIEQRKIKKNTPVLYYSNALLVNENLQPLGNKLHQTPPLVSYTSLLTGSSALGCTMVFNNFLKEIIYSSKIEYSAMHDKTAILIAALMGEVIYDFEPSILYRQHPNNVTTSGGNFKKRLVLVYKRRLKNRDESVVLEAQQHIRLFGSKLKEADKKYAELFASSRTNLSSRIKLICDKNIICSNPKFTKKFKIRLLLGLA